MTVDELEESQTAKVGQVYLITDSKESTKRGFLTGDIVKVNSINESNTIIEFYNLIECSYLQDDVELKLIKDTNGNDTKNTNR